MVPTTQLSVYAEHVKILFDTEIYKRARIAEAGSLLASDICKEVFRYYRWRSGITGDVGSKSSAGMSTRCTKDSETAHIQGSL
jgi:hypothetical protein